MKIAHLFSNRGDEAEVIAYFGQAKLIKRLDSKYELRGGSLEDHTAAKEWISLFMHEIVLVRSSLPEPELSAPLRAVRSSLASHRVY